MGRKKSKQPKKKAVILTHDNLLKLFKEAGKPLSRAEILRAMKLPKHAKKDLRIALRSMVESGKIIRIRRAYGLAEAMSLITGKLEMQRGGFGFVIPEDVRRKDIFISQKNLNNAWHGDKVVCAIIAEKKGKNHEGRIVRILERGRKVLPVKVVKRMRDNEWLCRPTDPLLGFGVWVDGGDLNLTAEPGDVLVVEPGDQIDPSLWEAVAVEMLGPEKDLRVQEALVKSNHTLRLRFPSGASDQAEALPEVPRESDFADRRDLRDMDFVTIDGADAKDFDDAVFVERDGPGWKLWVAIADVSHYVRPGTPLDREALERGNSYYFPMSVEPMFPERLSNGLCSLRPNEPRLAMVAVLNLTAQAKVTGCELFPAVIESSARLTYDQIRDAILERNEEAQAEIGEELVPMLNRCEVLARVMRKVRFQRGGLDFDIPDAKAVVNDEGEVVRVQSRERHFGHMIIEEFMIAANEAVARFLEERELPCVYRIHPHADPDKLRSLFRLLNTTNPEIKRVEEPTPRDLQKLVEDVAGTPLEFLVNRLLLRSMKQAQYSPLNEGHFGLSSEAYAHFTSPIRRYADLLVHRMVKLALGANSSDMGIPGSGKLLKMCSQLNTCERRAMDAEREIYRRAAVLYLSKHEGEIFNGVISSIADYGFRVELKGLPIEGMVRLSSLDDDYYTYWPHREVLVGERTGRTFRMGQEVEVLLESASLERLEIDLSLKSSLAASMDYKDIL